MKKSKIKKINFKKLTIAKLNMLELYTIHGGKEGCGSSRPGNQCHTETFPTEITEKKDCFPSDIGCIDFTR